MTFDVSFTSGTDVPGSVAHTSTSAEQVGDGSGAAVRLNDESPAEAPRSVRDFARSIPIDRHEGSVIFVVVYVLTDMSGQRVWLGRGRFGPCAERESVGEARCFQTATKASRAAARLRRRDWFVRVAPLRIRVSRVSSERSTSQEY
jgi:hypothetical protein